MNNQHLHNYIEMSLISDKPWFLWLKEILAKLNDNINSNNSRRSVTTLDPYETGSKR